MRLLALIVISSITLMSCKDRSRTSALLSTEANAATSDEIRTFASDKIYPSTKMLNAALDSLNAAVAARASGNTAEFKKQLGKTRLHLRMRKARNAPVTAPASAGLITCKLERAGDSSQFITATSEVRVNEDDVARSGGSGLVVGSDNYSFDIGVFEGDKGALDLNVVFYENINTQDEVGSFLCPITSGTFCRDDAIQDDNGTIATFSCTRA